MKISECKNAPLDGNFTREQFIKGLLDYHIDQFYIDPDPEGSDHDKNRANIEKWFEQNVANGFTGKLHEEMKTEIKQGVSKFTEKDLTPNSAHSFTEGSDIGPLETHVQSELEKIQAGHEGYKVVPVELWEQLIEIIEAYQFLAKMEGHKDSKQLLDTVHAKMKSL